MSDTPITNKQVYKAVSNYLANELGVNSEFIGKILDDKINARNPDQLVQDAVAKYFNKGPNGWRADDVVKQAVQKAVERHIEHTLRSGGASQLNALLEEHLAQICGKPTQNNKSKTQPNNTTKSLPNTEKYNGAVFLNWFKADQIMLQWVQDTLGSHIYLGTIKHYPEVKDEYIVLLTHLDAAPNSTRQNLKKELNEKHVLVNTSHSLKPETIAKILSESPELKHYGMKVSKYLVTRDGLLCLPEPEPLETDASKWPQQESR